MTEKWISNARRGPDLFLVFFYRVGGIFHCTTFANIKKKQKQRQLWQREATTAAAAAARELINIPHSVLYIGRERETMLYCLFYEICGRRSATAGGVGGVASLVHIERLSGSTRHALTALRPSTMHSLSLSFSLYLSVSLSLSAPPWGIPIVRGDNTGITTFHISSRPFDNFFIVVVVALRASFVFKFLFCFVLFGFSIGSCFVNL